MIGNRLSGLRIPIGSPTSSDRFLLHESKQVTRDMIVELDECPRFRCTVQGFGNVVGFSTPTPQPIPCDNDALELQGS
eukprot:scaffold909_cov135-Cylindrotheca_fusiformis.AAC.9